MGCNLCSLQKREEHYKLLYEISQVNGRDLSRASHEEAAEALRSAKDPIVVQVLRRTPRPRGQGSAQDVQLVDVCTQTEITFEHIMALAKLRPATPPVPDICPFLLSDSCLSLHTMDQEYLEGSEYLSNMAADAERTDDFEYEEVELLRLSSQEKLGLTLCYRTDEDEDIYVSEIEPNSIAARDGRIREGDRILQINGRDVQDRQEAVAVLSNEECRNIVLLVARPEIQEEPWLDDEHSEYLEELKMEMLEEEEEMKRAAREEDQKKSMEPEKSVLAQIQKQLSRCLSGRSSADGAEKDERCRQLLELKCQIRNGSEYDLFYARSSIQCSGVEHELRMLNEELRSIQLECQSIMKVGMGSESYVQSYSTVKSFRHLFSYLGLLRMRTSILRPFSHAKQHLMYLHYCKGRFMCSVLNICGRYITKRPVRDRLLRERALKIKEERSGGMTTDDDAMSEMKMGRYWSKEQRKQHLLRAKEQRRRREFMQRSRLESLRENPLSSGEGRSEPSIIELSHRKMMKKRNKKILDNWMTIQELMTHGEKAPEGSAVHNAFLSVTTV
uniref:PDZ domain containing ring finger 4 n=1 Tax=Cyprinus carpio TaxID=7962 RepID=A0A8C2JKF8_CYPCA